MKPIPLHYCLPRLIAGLSLILPLSLLHSEPGPPPLSSLDDSQVFITYGELRRLITAATPPAPSPPPPQAPVPACLTLAAYQLRFVQDLPQLLATFTVENLTDQWASVSLGACHAGLLEPLPADTRLARIKGDLHLLLENRQRVELALQILPSADGTFSLHPPPEAALATLTLADPPANHVTQLTHTDGRSTRHGGAALIGFGIGESPLRLAVVANDATPTPRATMNSVIITEAAFSTQIARDGAQLTSLRLQVEHGSTELVALQLPEGAELLRCTVAGKPIVNEPSGAGPLQLPLAAPTSPTPDLPSPGSEVTLSYFLQGQPLHEAEGELTLSLPRTPQLIRQLDWTVELPEGLELTAHGSIEIQPAAAPQRNVLQLTRRLCRDSATEARITYRKPNTLR